MPPRPCLPPSLRQSIITRRSVNTSIFLRNQTNSPTSTSNSSSASVSSSSPSSPTTTTTAESLGFKKHVNRKRDLGVIISQSPTSNQDINIKSRTNNNEIFRSKQRSDNNMGPRSNKTSEMRSGSRNGRRPQGIDDSDKSLASPRQMRDQRNSDSKNSNLNSSEDIPTDFFEGNLVEPLSYSSNSPRRSRNSKSVMSSLAVETDILDSSNNSSPISQRFAPRQKGRERQNMNGSGSTSTNTNLSSSGPGGPRSRGVGGGGRGGNNTRKKHSRSGGGSVGLGFGMPIRETERRLVVVDQSPKALFGRQSLLSPALRASRSPENSIWAKGIESSEARKLDLLRLAGSYEIYQPKPAHPTPTRIPNKDAKQWGNYLIAFNNSISLRNRDGGKEVLDKYL